MKNTITQIGIFGKEREYTKEEYVKIWVAQVSDLHMLADTDQEYRTTNVIKNTVENMAKKAFDRILASQNK